MEYLSIIITVAIIHLLGVISPGPDFIMTARNSLKYSTRTGVYSSVGLGLSTFTHIAYCLAGVALIISQSILLFTIIKFIGAGYLMYIGYKSLKSKTSELSIVENHIKNDISKIKAIKIGYLTDILNPKATLLFLSIFTVVITPNTPLWAKIFMWLEMSVVTFLWYAFVASIISHKSVKSRIVNIQHYAEKFIGVVLIMLGIKVALSTSK